MSAMKRLIEDVEELYAANLSNAEIMRRTGIELDTLEQVLCYIDEINYHEDMLANPYQEIL
jgi:hypothetical protein